MDQRRITEEQRSDFEPWLLQVFTPTLTTSLMDHHIPKVQGGYIVDGFLDIIPVLGPHTTNKHKLTKNEDSSYTYSVQLSGETNIVTLSCIFVPEDDQWKIDQYSHQYMND